MNRPRNIFLVFFMAGIIFFNVFVHIFINGYVSIFQFYLEKLPGIQWKDGMFLFLLQKRMTQLVVLFLVVQISRREVVKQILLAVGSLCCAYLAVLTSLAYGMYTLVLYPLFFLPHGIAYILAFGLLVYGMKKRSLETILQGILVFLVGILLETYINYPVLAALIKKI